MKLLTQSGVGRQAARISQLTAKYRVGTSKTFAILMLAAASVITTGLQGCAGYTSAAAPSSSQQDPKAAVLTAGASTITFGNIAVGTTSMQNLTITNTGTAAANISQATISGTAFTVVGTSLSGALAVGQTVTIQIQFAPQSTGAASGTFAVASDASNSPVSVSLSGTGTAPGLTASPMALSFGSVDVGSTTTNTVTLTNSGSSTVNVSGVAPTGSGITVTGISLPAAVNAGANATFTVQFAPTTHGNVSGSVSITSDAPASPITVSVTGTGAQAELTSNPSSVSFGNVADGNSNSQPIQISNNGNATLTVSQVIVSGGANGFSTTGVSSQLVIQAGKSAMFNAVFGPNGTGNVSGSVYLYSNAPNSPLTINLSGTGVTPTRTLNASSTNVAFGNVNSGTTASQNVILTNTGNADVSISSVSANGTGFSVYGFNSLTTLTPNQTLALNIAFAPSSNGAATGTITVFSNAANSPQTISLSGTGVPVTQHSVALNWAASTTSGVVGYYVYRGTQSGNYTKISSSIATTSYTDSTVQSGQNITYFYVVTAVDGSGTESSDSNQVTATVP